MAANPGHCAACGFSGDVHEHHLVARPHGGLSLPSVYLCPPCHGAVHGLTFTTDHVALSKAGLAAAKARGVKLGNPNGAAHIAGRWQKEAVVAVKAKADERAKGLALTIESIRAGGATARQRDCGRAQPARDRDGARWQVDGPFRHQRFGSPLKKPPLARERE